MSAMPISGITNSSHLSCPSDDCSRWFHSVSGLKKHVRKQHPLHEPGESSTSGLDPVPAPRTLSLSESHDLGPHPSPEYRNPTSSPPPHTPFDYEPYDDPGYRSDQEDEEDDAGGSPSPPRSLPSGSPYNDNVNKNEDDAAPTTRNSHQVLNGAQYNLPFIFLPNETYK